MEKWQVMKNEDEIRKIIHDAISRTKTMASAARLCGVHFNTFKRYAQKFNLYNPNPSGRGTLRRDIHEILKNGVSIRTADLKKRLFSSELRRNECQECGIIEWNGKPITLELDHINGIRNDNRLDNLRILCPNCHSQTDTYKGRNKSSTGLKAISDNEFIMAFKSSSNMHQLNEHLNVSMGGGNVRAIKKRMQLLGLKFDYIDISNINEHSLQSLLTKKAVIKTKKCKCGADIGKTAKSCVTCSKIMSRKVMHRPSKDMLIQELRDGNFSSVGRKYGVSDNTVRKWIKQ